MPSKRTYFDYAATTPMDDRLLDDLQRDLTEAMNPASIHHSGQRARRRLEEARERLAATIGAAPGDVVFTSGATEAVNLAIRGLAQALGGPMRVASSAIEHSCVGETPEALAAGGEAQVEPLPVGEDGRVRFPDDPPPVDLLCLMHANNETGVVQNVAAARQWRESNQGLWLCDASQSAGKVALELAEIGADLLVLSSHKVYGPAGIGCLAGPAVHRLVPQLTGGPHENERRAGTPAVALARAFARALELAEDAREAEARRLGALEDRLLDTLAQRHVLFERNGAGEMLPGLLNLSIRGFEGADLAIGLDQRGFEVSPGSACSTGVVSVSPVLEAMFPLDNERAAAGIRITMGRQTDVEAVDALAAAMAELASSSV